MKLALYLTLLLVVASALILPNPVAGQSKLTERDKSQIIQTILRGYDFTQSETGPDIREYTILLRGANISPGDIPSRKGVKFTIVKQDEIDRLRKTGVEYYEFRAFEVTKTGVRVSFIRTYLSAKGANGSAMEYTCRKVGGRWKLKARLGAVLAS
jgi:hypothetical protein